MQSPFLHYLKSKNPTFIHYFKLSVVWPFILNDSSKLLYVFLDIASPNFSLNLILQNNPPFSHQKTDIPLQIHHIHPKTCSVKTWEHCRISTDASKLRKGIKRSHTILLLINVGKCSNHITSLSITPHLDVFVWWNLLPQVLGSKMHTQTQPTSNKKKYLFLCILTLHHYF